MANGNSNNRVALIFFAGAIVVAIAAIYGIFAILNGTRQLAQMADKPVETINVVAASRTLYQGVGITNDDLFVVNVPPEFLPEVKKAAEEGAQSGGSQQPEFATADIFQSREVVIGQVPRERILANEFIRPERLAEANSGVGLNAVIPRGMRAISVSLRGADAVSGFLEPGNYVDVLVTLLDEYGDARTETILQAVFVLGVDSRGQGEDQGTVDARGKVRPSVTFLVTPKQAEDIAYADEMGDISLSLRNVQDVNYTSLDGATLDRLLARLKPRIDDAPPVIRTPRRVERPLQPTGTTIRVIKGTSVTEKRVNE